MAVVADKVIVELEARIDGYSAKVKGAERVTSQAMGAIGQSASAAEKAVRNNVVAISDGSARAANASRNLGRQVADIGAQLAGGQSPFLILAQQAPQVADALADTGGRAARVASFFAGPWGAALLAAATVAGTLATKLFEGESAGKAAERGYDHAKAGADRLAAAIRGVREAANEQVDSAVVTDAASKLEIEIRRKQARLETTPGTRAGSQTRARLAREIAADRETLKDYQNDLSDLATRRAAEARQSAREDAAREAKSQAASRRSQARAEAKRGAADDIRKLNDEAAANDRLDSSLRSLEGSFDPVVDAAREYAGALDEISILSATGRLGPGKEMEYRFRAMADYAAKIGKAGAEGTNAIYRQFGVDPGADLKRIIDGIDSQTDADRGKRDERLGEQKRELASLADFYQRAFEGGTGSIWDTFRQVGTRAIAETLAKFTLKQLGDGGLQGLLSSAGSLLRGNSASNASIASFANSTMNSLPFGRASGGHVAGGQLVRVNEGASAGRVEGWRPQGSGTVIPLGQMSAMKPASGSTVVQTINLDLRGGITTPELIAQVNAIADQAAVRGAAGGSAMAQAALARRARQRLR